MMKITDLRIPTCLSTAHLTWAISLQLKSGRRIRATFPQRLSLGNCNTILKKVGTLQSVHRTRRLHSELSPFFVVRIINIIIFYYAKICQYYVIILTFSCSTQRLGIPRSSCWMSPTSPGLGVDLHNVIGLKAAASPDKKKTPTDHPQQRRLLVRMCNGSQI